MLLVDISEDAEADIDRVVAYIAFEVMNENAAVAFRDDITDTIAKLSYLGEALPYSQQPYIQKHFGMFARTINYKKMTIIYDVMNGVAYVRRVIPGKIIY
jgi:plasmid stabilization system protein ParE